MLKERSTTISGIARAIDLGLIVLSFTVASTACYGLTNLHPLGWLEGVSRTNEVMHEHVLLLLASLFSWIAVTEWRESYRSHRSEHLWTFLSDNANTQLVWIMAVGLLAFLMKLSVVRRRFFLTFLPLAIVILMARQLGTRVFLQKIRAKGRNIRRIVVIGEPTRVREFAGFIEREGGPGYQIVNVPTSLDRTTGEQFDEAFLALNDSRTDLEETVLKLVKLGKRVHIVPGLFDGSLFRQSVEDFAGVPILSVGGYGVDPIEAAAKRLMDLIGSSILLVMLSPILLLTALLVKVSSSGPILFAQERLGKDGQKFKMLKFRTMYRDAEDRLRSDPELYRLYLENNHKIPADADPRIVPFGRFLRSTSLDELPQFFNVFKGDMSLVGPRPITPPQLEQYGEYCSLFLSARPGITGYWQVSGRSEIKEFLHRVVLDLEYIRDQSLKTDVTVILKTIPAVLRRRGAQ